MLGYTSGHWALVAAGVTIFVWLVGFAVAAIRAVRRAPLDTDYYGHKVPSDWYHDREV